MEFHDILILNFTKKKKKLKKQITIWTQFPTKIDLVSRRTKKNRSQANKWTNITKHTKKDSKLKYN